MLARLGLRLNNASRRVLAQQTREYKINADEIKVRFDVNAYCMIIQSNITHVI